MRPPWSSVSDPITCDGPTIIYLPKPRPSRSFLISFLIPYKVLLLSLPKYLWGVFTCPHIRCHTLFGAASYLTWGHAMVPTSIPVHLKPIFHVAAKLKSCLPLPSENTYKSFYSSWGKQQTPFQQNPCPPYLKNVSLLLFSSESSDFPYRTLNSLAVSARGGHDKVDNVTKPRHTSPLKGNGIKTLVWIS